MKVSIACWGWIEINVHTWFSNSELRLVKDHYVKFKNVSNDSYTCRKTGEKNENL